MEEMTGLMKSKKITKTITITSEQRVGEHVLNLRKQSNVTTSIKRKHMEI